MRGMRYFALVILLSVAPLSGMPILMDRYNEHPASKPGLKSKCTICHVDPSGAGKLTAFGKDFEDEGLSFTNALLKDYPNFFNATGSATASAEAEPASEKPAFDPEAFYMKNCAECHLPTGQGNPLLGTPDFTNLDWHTKHPDPRGLVNSVLKGKNAMTPFEGKLTAEEVEKIIAFVRTLAAKK